MNTEKLLQQVIEMKKSIIEEQRQNAVDFNVFELAGIESKEVIMCRILYGLLSPKGTHGRNTLFLKSFAEQVLGLNMEDEELSTAVVRREHVIKGERRIDLVIETKDRFIPIEAKIYAKDQYNQCLDYYKHANEKNSEKKSVKEWYIYYLTLTGYEPSMSSTGGEKACIEKLKLISWEKSIYEWICNILDHPDIKKLPNIREVLCQFRDTILKICGKSNREISWRVTEMIKKDAEHMKAAKLVNESYQIACTEFLKGFFQKLEDAIEEKMKQIGNVKLTKMNLFDVNKQIDEFYSAQRSTNPGLDYKITDLLDDYVMVLRIEVDWRLFMGILIAKKSVDENGNVTYSSYKNIPLEVINVAKEKLSLGDDVNHDNNSNWWLTWKYMPDKLTDPEETCAPDFKQMNDAYYNLYDDNKCRKVIEAICTQIEEYYNAVK